MGPAIASEEKLLMLLKAGANIFRLNMSHGTHEVHGQYIALIRHVEKIVGRPIPILADIQGPKLRVGDLPDGIFSLRAGTEVILCSDSIWQKVGKPADIIPLRYDTLAKDVKKGDALLFDDGLLKVEVLETDGTVVKALVINGGILKSRKGINLPNTIYSQPALTPKDKKDIVFAIEQGADYLAISFVRFADDMIKTRRYVERYGGDQHLIAKIEKPEALVNLIGIIEASDAVMIARGDLGVEIPASQVPILQKKIIHTCHAYNKPVITATQMLESMIQNPRPTRAEASDVANAVLDGTDCVMLSAETSVGAWPAEAVHFMRTICKDAETHGNAARVDPHIIPESHQSPSVRSISKAIAAMSHDLGVSCIAALTYSGKTVRSISNRRPSAPIISITQDLRTSRKVSLYWGVYPLMIPNVQTTDETIEHIKQELVTQKIATKGSTILVTIGRPLTTRSRTNMISIEKI